MAGGRSRHRLDKPRAVPDATDDMGFLCPDRIPNRDVVEARVEDIRHLGIQRGERRPRRSQRCLRLGRLADEIIGAAAEQMVIQQTAPLYPHANRIHRPVAGHHATSRQPPHPLETLHLPRMRLAQIRAVEDHPDRRLAAQLLNAALP